MNSERYPVQNYIPSNPMKKLGNGNCVHDLSTTLQKMTFQKIIDDPDYHFKNCYISNFDLIHHECRGDKLSYSRKHYQTIFIEQINKEITNDDLRYRFISSAIKSKQDDVFFGEKVFIEHFNRNKLEEEMKKKGVFLSAMKKKVSQNRKYSSCW